MTKTQLIREYFAKNESATSADAAAALEEHGVTKQLVASVRSRDAKKPTRAKAGVTKKAAKARKKSDDSKSTRGNSRPYPQRSLEEALLVPKAIREINNGRPMSTEQVAKASVNLSKSNKKFFYIAAASRDYGLTIGSRDTEEISLAPLGSDVFFAEDENVRKQKMIDAFMSVDLFKKVYEYYEGSSAIPTEGEFFANVLVKEFQLDPEFHEDFEKVFRANCRFLGIEDGLSAAASEKAKSKAKEFTSENIRVVGAAKSKFDRTAFVVMPFSEKGAEPRPGGFFEAVLNCIIVPAGNSAGFAVETAQQKGSDVIHTTIINALLEADLVIADLTDHNPNVLCELGIRLANEKPVALIRAAGAERIFDVDILRIEDYSPNIWPTTVDKDIPRIADHIKATWDNRDSMRPYMEILTGRSQSR